MICLEIVFIVFGVHFCLIMKRARPHQTSHGLGFSKKKRLKSESRKGDVFWQKEQKLDNIGLKLLSKMGWTKGEGLGKEKQGISENITVSVNTTKKGIGLLGKKKQTYPRRCIPCDTELGSPTTWGRHTESPQHLQRSLDATLKQNPSKMDFKTPWNCYLCHKSIEHRLSYETHIRSKIHFKKLHAAKPAKYPKRCDLCDVQWDSLSGFQKHVESRDHLQRTLNENGSVPSGSAPIFPRRCYLCIQTYHSTLDWDRHSKSRGHLKLSQLQTQSAAITEFMESTESTESNESMVMAENERRCELCDLVVDVDLFRDHLSGKRHRRNMRLKQKRNPKQNGLRENVKSPMNQMNGKRESHNVSPRGPGDVGVRGIESKTSLSASHRVRISNLPRSFTEEMLTKLCSRFGRFSALKMYPSDRNTFAFVTFEGSDAAKRACLKLNGKSIRNHTLCAEFANRPNRGRTVGSAAPSVLERTESMKRQSGFEYSCDLCGIAMSSVMALQQHKNGRRHREKVREKQNGERIDENALDYQQRPAKMPEYTRFKGSNHMHNRPFARVNQSKVQWK